MAENIYDIEVKTIDGKAQKLSEYRGKALLIVNVASKCGYTPQYTGLEELQKEYAERGLVVMGFPRNQFGAQEPGSEADIQSFCTLNFGVTFPMFAKVDVNGPGEHPLFTHLKKAQPGMLGTEGIKWNFTKFLVGRDGRVLDRYAPQTEPADLRKPIEKALAG